MTWHPGDFSFKVHGTGGNKIKITGKKQPFYFANGAEGVACMTPFQVMWYSCV